MFIRARCSGANCYPFLRAYWYWQIDDVHAFNYFGAPRLKKRSSQHRRQQGMPLLNVRVFDQRDIWCHEHNTSLCLFLDYKKSGHKVCTGRFLENCLRCCSLLYTTTDRYCRLVSVWCGFYSSLHSADMYCKQCTLPVSIELC